MEHAMRISSTTSLPPSRTNNNPDQRLLELPAPKALGFGNDKVLIEEDLYNRFIAWDRDAMLNFGVALDEMTRMARLLTDASSALCFGGGCFVTRAVNSKLPTKDQRHVLTLARKFAAITNKSERSWIIEP